MSSSSAAASFHRQREILRRGPSQEATQALFALASEASRPLHARASAIFALKQLDGVKANDKLLELAKDPTAREFALRALADRKSALKGIDSGPFMKALSDPSARVRAQALIALGRIGDAKAAPSIIPMTSRPDDAPMPSTRPVQAQPDPDRVLPHLAMRALVALDAVDACLDAIDGPHREGALRALRFLHEPRTVEGLIKKLATARSSEARKSILATLVRLYHREAEYDGSWWGIRPDTTGPYYDPTEWECSGRIASVLKTAALDGDSEMSAFLRGELGRQRVQIEGLAESATDRPKAEEAIHVLLTKADPKNPNQIGNLTYEIASNGTLQAKGDAIRGKTLFASRWCRACHTDADGQTPKGPHLVDIGKRYNATDLVESILKPSAKLAQGYETYSFATTDGRVFTGFVVGEGGSTVRICESSGTLRELKRSGSRGAPSARVVGYARGNCGESRARTTRRYRRLSAFAQTMNGREPKAVRNR